VNQLFMIDTNTISYIVKGTSAAARHRMSNLQSGEVACISAITEGEIRYGLAKMATLTAPTKTSMRSAIQDFLARIQVLGWGKQEASVYGALRANQERRGMTLANLDMLIAAHAVAVRAVLVTNDKSFARVSELSPTVSWANDL
jgi:tRNA(fMet)-specific endonuclease VapC